VSGAPTRPRSRAYVEDVAENEPEYERVDAEALANPRQEAVNHYNKANSRQHAHLMCTVPLLVSAARMKKGKERTGSGRRQ
jgi:hypothetical protein